MLLRVYFAVSAESPLFCKTSTQTVEYPEFVMSVLNPGYPKTDYIAEPCTIRFIPKVAQPSVVRVGHRYDIDITNFPSMKFKSTETELDLPRLPTYVERNDEGIEESIDAALSLSGAVDIELSSGYWKFNFTITG